MKAIIPFKLTCIPMKKLALINFEKDPDEVYQGLPIKNSIDGEIKGKFHVITDKVMGTVGGTYEWR